MMVKRLGTLFMVWVLGFAALGYAGCGSGGDNSGGGGGGGVVALDAAGDYFVTKFFGTNVQDSNKVVDALQKGLTIYMTLKSDNTISAGAQAPDQNPRAITMTGTWSIDADNNLTIKLIDQDNNQRTIVGKLSQSASGDVTFEGSQTDGASIELDSSGGQYTITTLGLFQYDHAPTLADLAGNYKATSSVGISNTASDVTVDMLPPGDSLDLTINSDGTGSAESVSGGQPDSMTLHFSVEDSFHLTVETSPTRSMLLTFRLRDGILTVWNYDTTAVFPNLPNVTGEQSATQIIELQRQ